MTELLKCPFCGGPLAIFTATEGLHAEGGCEACGWSMEEWSGSADKLAQRMNLRPAGDEGLRVAAEALVKLWKREPNFSIHEMRTAVKALEAAMPSKEV